MSPSLPQKVIDQIRKAALPTGGAHPFKPKLLRNWRGDYVIEKRAVAKGPKKGKRGFVDDQERIWIKDRAHANAPDHWDVQIDGGDDYFRVDQNGEELP